MQHINICGFWVLFLLPLFAGCSENIQKPLDIQAPVSSQTKIRGPLRYNEELSNFLERFVSHSGVAFVIEFTEPVVVSTDYFPGFGGRVYGFDYESGTRINNLEGRVVLFCMLPPFQSPSLHILDGQEHLRVDMCVEVNGQTARWLNSKLYRNEWTFPSNVQGDWRRFRSQGTNYFKVSHQYRGYKSDNASPADEEKRLIHELVQLHVKLATPDDIAGAKLETIDNPNGRWEFGKISLLVAKIKKADGEEKRKLEREQLKWIRRAAEKGHVLAQQSIVDFYDSSSERGVVWGNKLEQYAWTAVLKHRRENVQEDRDGAEIKRILRREAGSADTGDLLAIRNANPSDVGLSAEELSEAKLLAADYIDQYVPTKE